MREWCIFITLFTTFQHGFCYDRKCLFPVDDYLYNEKVLVLLSTESMDAKNIQDKFATEMRQLGCGKYFIFVNTKDIINTISIYQIIKTKEWRYIIDLSVTDFYHTNYNELAKSGLIYAGDIPNITVTTEICNGTTIINDRGYETCKHAHVTQYKYVKLVTDTLLNDYKEIYDYVINFIGTEPTLYTFTDKRPLIIVCGEENINTEEFMYLFNDYIYNIVNDELSIKFNVTCPEVNVGASLVIAPKPYQFSDGLSKTPTLFYNQLYLPSSTKDVFINAFTAFELRSQLSAFMKFIEKMKWKRVAVISDDSEDSAVFERQLTSVFDENNIAYVSEMCQDRNCSFEKVLGSLYKPIIVIANVKEEYATTLAEQWPKSKYTYNFIWVVRDWSTVASESAAKILNRDVFSIRLGYTLQTDHDNYLENLRETSYDLYFVYNKLIVLLETIIKWNNINWEDIYEVVEYLKVDLSTTFSDIGAYVIRARGNGPSKMVANMAMRSHTVLNYTQIIRFKISSSPLIKECTFINQNYVETCSDNDFLLIMLVISVFFVTMTAVLCFFENVKKNYTRMSC